MRNEQFVIDRERFDEALKAKGYSSVSELAKKLDLHRNTLGIYLQGKRSPLPEALEKVFIELGLGPEVIKPTARSINFPAMHVEKLISSLHKKYSQGCYFLFGSRARGTEKKFSDYDIGIFSRAGLPFQEFSKLLDIVGEWNESQLRTVELVNFSENIAEEFFSAATDGVFLAGNLSDWLELLKKGGVTIHG